MNTVVYHIEMAIDTSGKLYILKAASIIFEKEFKKYLRH